jgi:hypothetical protein
MLFSEKISDVYMCISDKAVNMSKESKTCLNKNLGSSSFLPKALWQFQQSCQFTDLTIACSNGSVAAHKAMLSCVFKMLDIDVHSEESDKIIIYDVKVFEMEKALEDLYLNSVNENILRIFGPTNVKYEIIDQSEQIECKVDTSDYGDFNSMMDEEIHAKDSLKCTITEDLKMKILINNPLNAKKPLRPKHIQRIQQLSCDECDHIARDTERLENHKKRHHNKHQNEEDLKHHCEYCDFKTKFPRSLENHRREEHPNWKSIRKLQRLACDQCDFVGKRPEYLDKHKKREHGIKYPCDQCGASYLDLDKLEVHRRYKHEKRLHTCEGCSFQSYFKSAVAKHFKEQHTDQMFYCDQCSYSTKFQGRIKIHIDAKHEGKRFYCKQCEFSAPYQGGLNRHVKMRHQGITYSCEFCDHRATTRSNLKLHVDAKHLGIKYSCDLCDYQASQPGSLKIHKQNQHNFLSPIQTQV